MIKKTITYKDYNDNERTEDFYFNLTEAEAAELELGVTGGLSEMIMRISSTQDIPTIIKVFKELIVKSYGEKSPDGKRFMKKDKDGNLLADAFVETEAYSILFMELAQDPDKASAFFNAVIPGTKNATATNSSSN